jgi:uncharacterized integral membrane protein
MRLVFSLMLILLVLVFFGFLITNSSQRVEVTVGSTQYPDVWLPVVAFIALTVGVVFTAVVALFEGATIRLTNRRLRREIQRLQTEQSFLRSSSPDVAPPPGEPDVFDVAEVDPELHEVREEAGRARPASAPVYDPGAVDPATRGD